MKSGFVRLVLLTVSSFGFSSASIASIKLNVTCNVLEEVEQGGNIASVETYVATLASHGEEATPLKLNVYGGRVAVRPYLASRKSDSVCTYKKTAICLQSGRTQMCEDDKVIFRPKDGQNGEQITVSCQVAGDTALPCQF